MTKFDKIEQTTGANCHFMNVLVKTLHLKNDAALSRLLEVAPPVISKIRSGKLKIGATMVIKIHEVSDMSIERIKQFLLDDTK